LNFDAPGIDDDSRPVLLFRVNPNGATQLQVIINGEEVGTSFSFHPDGDARSFHEVVAAGLVKPANNTLEARRISESGSINVADIVLLYQQEEFTPVP
jgi:hypothetical protein